jgi:hypothetical protein
LPTKRWSAFFLYLGRILILLIILAVILPKIAAVFNIWMSSHLHNEQRPIGNPLRVETPGWSKFVIQLFPNAQKER